MNKSILLIPHYNNPDGLYESLRSIHPEEEIDVLVVDDGSNHRRINEQESNEAFSAKGVIVYKYLPENKGIEYTLNQGLKIIHEKGYEYIARLDCGDINLGRRFTIQEEYLRLHEEIVLIGSNAIAVDLSGKELFRINFPHEHEKIKKKMYLNSMFLHPTVMFKTHILNKVGFYPTTYNAAEDFAFFFKIVNNYKTANIQQNLVKFEINPNGISLTKRKQQVRSRIIIIKENFYLGFWPLYGLFRNYLILIIPNTIIQFFKQLL